MELVFTYHGEPIIVKIEGHSVTFATQQHGINLFVPIERLQLSHEGIIKEHPDLKDWNYSDAKVEAIRRFKNHVQSLEGENRIKEYVTFELEKIGYKLISVKMNGFRSKNGI